jgi:hypothetical protein
MDNRRPGCLSGFLQLFLLDKVYNWMQEKFGYKRGGCMGCGCGFIMMVVFIMLVFSIIFKIDWFRLSF